MHLLGIVPHETSDPRKYQQVKEVVSYFSDTPNYRYQILKVLAKSSGNKLDAVWNYVALQNERISHLQKLDPSDFSQDIEAQLKDKYLTNDKVQLLKSEIKKQREEALEAKRQEAAKQRKEDSAKQQVFNLDKLDIYEDALKGVEHISKELLQYG